MQFLKDGVQTVLICLICVQTVLKKNQFLFCEIVFFSYMYINGNANMYKTDATVMKFCHLTR